MENNQDQGSQPQDQGKTSIVDKVKEGLHGVSETISHGVDAVKSAVFKSGESSEPKTTNEWEEAEKAKTASTEQSQGGEGTQQENKSLTDKIKGGVSDMISHGVDTVKGALGQTQNKESQGGEGDTDFHKVTTGFSETVQEHKHEQRVDELGKEVLASNNPFEALGGDNAGIAQPLNPQEVVGGNINQLTQNVTVSHSESQDASK